MSTSMLYFTTRIGAEKKQVPFPVSPSLDFVDVVEEVCKKFGVNMQTLSLATPAGVVLTQSDFMKSVQNVMDEYGFAFEIIDQGVVGEQ
jgi:hypothetical protein